MAERAFAAARKSNEDRRPRKCIWHLSFALAAYLLAGDLESATSALGNIGAAFADLHYYSDAIAIQRIALISKEQHQYDTANIVRSQFLIAKANYRLGNYDDTLFHLERAGGLRPPDNERSELERRTRDALDLLRQWQGALSCPSQNAAESLADGQRCERDGESSAALVAYAGAAGRARLSDDAAVEARARLGAACLFSSAFTMHPEAAAQAAIAAALAEKTGAADELVHAHQVQGTALMEYGEFSAACSAFEAGLAGLARQSASRLELELATGRSFALFCGGSPEDSARQLDQTLENASQIDADEAVQMWYLRSAQLFRAGDHLEAAIQILKAATQRIGAAGAESHRAADIHSELAQCYFVSDRADDAVRTLDQAITFAEQAGDERSIGRNYVNMACAYLDIDKPELAVTALTQAEPHVEASQDHALQSYFSSVSMDAAARALRRACRAAVGPPESSPIGGVESHSSTTHLLRAKIAEVENGQTAGSPEVLASLYAELATMLDRADRFDESKQAFGSALRIAGVGKLRGSIMQNYGVCLARSGDIKAARSVFEAALASKDLFAGGDDRLSSLVSLARVNLALHLPADYLSLARQIEAESGQLPVDQRPPYLAQVAELYEGSGHLAEARTAISGAVDLLRTQATEANEADIAPSVLAYAAKIELKHDNLEQAENAGRDALDALEAQRLYTRTSRSPRWQAQVAATTLVLIDTLYQSGHARAADALTLLETAKARSILQRYGLWLVQQPANFPAELREREDRFLTMLRYHEYFGETADPVVIERMELIESATYSQAQEFWDSLPEPWQAYGALRQGKPVDLPTLIREIRSSDNVHFIVLLPAQEQTLAWHLAPDGSTATWTNIPVGHDVVMAVGQETLNAAAERKALPDAWRQLSRQLTEPWLRDVPEGSTICFIPSRSAVELPLSLLETGDGYLVERNPVVILPSLSLLAYWAGSRPRQAVGNPVVLGDSLGDLPSARLEAQTVAERLGTDAFLGTKVIRALISRPLEHCDLLHVSGHARFDHTSPERSGFTLADKSTFSPRDALRLRMNAHLAVLSGCESGRLTIGAGDDLTGVASSLLSAGMRSIMATSWPIPDSVTPILIDEFYNGLLDEQVSIASALRSAQRKVLSCKRYSHPFYWASFRLLGDWRNNLAGDREEQLSMP
jgi:CHAT domain-containing protein